MYWFGWLLGYIIGGIIFGLITKYVAEWFICPCLIKKRGDLVFLLKKKCWRNMKLHSNQCR